MLRTSVFACTLLAITSVALTQARAGNIESLGTDVAIALPVIAAGATFAHDRDWTGLAELGVDTLATVATSYALKHVVREQRPDRSDFQSFPSNTAALTFAPAAFLWDRYGLPAYAAAGFVAYSSVDATPDGAFVHVSYNF